MEKNKKYVKFKIKEEDKKETIIYCNERQAIIILNPIELENSFSFHLKEKENMEKQIEFINMSIHVLDRLMGYLDSISINI